MTCIKDDPRPSLWPPADFDLNFRSNADTFVDAAGLGLGSLREREDGCWEMHNGNGGWVEYNPANPGHIQAANFTNRYTPRWLGGHYHGLDPVIFSPIEWIKDLEGRDVAAGSMDVIDTWYSEARFTALWTRHRAAFPEKYVAPPDRRTTAPPIVIVAPPPGQPPVVTPATNPALRELQGIKNLMETKIASLPTAGGGKPVNELRNDFRAFLKALIEVAKRGGALILLPCLLPLLAGCSGDGSLLTLLPGGATMADAQWHGVKSGKVTSLTAALLEDVSPTAAAGARLAFEGLGQKDPAGWLMPVSVVGEAAARQVKCVGKFADKCVNIPLNAVVHVAGPPEGRYFGIHRLAADDFND